jgi:hypothetical protein
LRSSLAALESRRVSVVTLAENGLTAAGVSAGSKDRDRFF